MKKETILVFGAHSDDEVIGMGGTILKYVAEGKKVIVVVFTSGEFSSPWLRKEILIEERRKEGEKIKKLLGVTEVINLGVKDSTLKKEVDNPDFQKVVRELILKYKPSKIFTHSKYDHHAGGDHKAAHKLVIKEVNKLNKNISLFTYEVWNISNEIIPRMYVDVSDTFKKKIHAMRRFRSQWLYVYILMIPVIVRSRILGLQLGTKYVERFYKIK